jgi:hypothetical protein
VRPEAWDEVNESEGGFGLPVVLAIEMCEEGGVVCDITAVIVEPDRRQGGRKQERVKEERKEEKSTQRPSLGRYRCYQRTLTGQRQQRSLSSPELTTQVENTKSRVEQINGGKRE